MEYSTKLHKQKRHSPEAKHVFATCVFRSLQSAKEHLVQGDV